MTVTRAALLPAALLLLAGPAQAQPEPMTREAIAALGDSVVGYSYWWGGSQWRMDGTQHGECIGSGCPDNCTHSGSYGADCSGFVGKAWQVPRPSPVEERFHPYDTDTFRYQTTHWTRISPDDLDVADAVVHSLDHKGHIMLYDSGDPWGSAYVWECRGCSYGCVHNLKTFNFGNPDQRNSNDIAIRRDLLDEASLRGTLRGVVFVDRGQGTADISERIPGAAVSVDSGDTATADQANAHWSFELREGRYRVTASASGYSTETRSCEVVRGEESWCSVGLWPDCLRDCTGRECGADPVCGESCGTCTAPETCSAGQCVCTPDCGTRECGPDPACGESCGACDAGAHCGAEGQCLPDDCVPDCGDRVCGFDPVCGTRDCGRCGAGMRCSDGQCVPDECLPDCGERECGLDPVCGTLACGDCAAGSTCNSQGRCIPDDCQPECVSRDCGPDPACGESCGVCDASTVCGSDGRCRSYDASLGKLYGLVLLTADPQAGPDPQTDAPQSSAWVSASTGKSTTADENGYYEMLLDPGPVTLTGAANGCDDGTVECQVMAGQGAECHVPVYEEGAGPDPDPGGSGSSGGCGAAGAPASLLGLLLLGLALLARRRGRAHR